jgi:hypothetical protein
VEKKEKEKEKKKKKKKCLSKGQTWRTFMTLSSGKMRL